MGKVINLENKKEGEHMGTYNVLSVAHVFLTYEGMTQKKITEVMLLCTSMAFGCKWNTLNKG